MWLQRKYHCKGFTKFFRLIFRHDTLSNYYETNFALIQHHKYSLTELENMLPWERSIYISLLLNYLKEEKERLDLQRQTRKK